MLQSSHRNQMLWWVSNSQALLDFGSFSLFKKSLRSETRGYFLGTADTREVGVVMLQKQPISSTLLVLLH